MKIILSVKVEALVFPTDVQGFYEVFENDLVESMLRQRVLYLESKGTMYFSGK